jgi:hypothetical protein
MREEYEPIPFNRTDERLFLLKFEAGMFKSFEFEFTQLDILQIMKHLEHRNDRLHDKFRRAILEADKVMGEKTEFNRKLPQRRYNGKIH